MSDLVSVGDSGFMLFKFCCFSHWYIITELFLRSESGQPLKQKVNYSGFFFNFDYSNSLEESGQSATVVPRISYKLMLAFDSHQPALQWLWMKMAFSKIVQFRNYSKENSIKRWYGQIKKHFLGLIFCCAFGDLFAVLCGAHSCLLLVYNNLTV